MPRHSKSRTKGIPTLSPAILADPDAFVLAIDALLRGDRTYGRQTKKVLKEQRELRALVDANAWEAYFSVEETVNQRFADALLSVAGWAFAEAASRGHGDDDHPDVFFFAGLPGFTTLLIAFGGLNNSIGLTPSAFAMRTSVSSVTFARPCSMRA
jgi:hypothetical protein